MPTQRWESCALVAEVGWRRLALRCLVHVTRASWQIVLDSWLRASSRIAQTECTHLPELLVHHANQWASMDVCDRKRGGCGAIMNYVHSAASIAHKEAKARMKGKKKEVTTISQRAAQIVKGAHTKEKEDVARRISTKKKSPISNKMLAFFSVHALPFFIVANFSVSCVNLGQHLVRTDTVGGKEKMTNQTDLANPQAPRVKCPLRSAADSRRPKP